MASEAPGDITWAVLLGRWVEFARSALALPDDAEGQRWRQSVPDIIMLQAVTFALRQLDELDQPERSLGLDRAQILIDRHADHLHGRFGSGQLPPGLRDLVQDARQQLARSLEEIDRA